MSEPYYDLDWQKKFEAAGPAKVQWQMDAKPIYGFIMVDGVMEGDHTKLNPEQRRLFEERYLRGSLSTAPSGEERDLLRYEMTAQNTPPAPDLAKLQAELRAVWEIVRQKERDAYQGANALDVQELDALNTQLALEVASLSTERARMEREREELTKRVQAWGENLREALGQRYPTMEEVVGATLSTLHYSKQTASDYVEACKEVTRQRAEVSRLTSELDRVRGALTEQVTEAYAEGWDDGYDRAKDRYCTGPGSLAWKGGFPEDWNASETKQVLGVTPDATTRRKG